ncbi:MAG: class I SAM-dependent methyltransferase [Alphaproteobacteria bacterium]|nr:class I SAM-dependent methyltransferase [Alphaproteobacteria bacterium]
MNIEQSIAAHYGDETFGKRLLEALSASGLDINRLSPDELAPIDEFHIGGRLATAELAAQLGLRPGLKLLDVGSGIGGPARYFAHAFGCEVIGIDLTEAFVRIATDLTRRASLSDRVKFQQGSALDLPFEAASFDGATMLHVGMNIDDKPRLCRAVRKVLRPGAFFGIYDLMRTGPGDIEFPVPWSSRPETSFVVEPSVYRAALEAAGFTLSKERNRRDFALDFFRDMQAKAKAAGGGASPLGPALIMGPEFKDKLRHVVEAIERGAIAPIELIARVP